MPARARRTSTVPFHILAIVLATRLSAQTPPPPVEVPRIEVVVTRIPEATHEVAASVEVIGGDEIRARGATSLEEALALAAGVAIAPGGDAGPAGAVPELWGLREFDAFLLVVDGVPWGGAFNPALTTLSLRDVERIEVLRGPAPVTYGATSFVGVIHVVHKSAANTSRYVEAHGGSYGSGGGGIDIPIGGGGAWKSRLSGDFDSQGFRDDRTSYTRGHALWRTARLQEDRNIWFNADVNILRQDPASPHPRQGPGLSSAVPLDANYNPDGAFLNEDRFALSAGFERPLGTSATWGTTTSFTHSAQHIFRGFLTDVSNSPDNAAGFRENIDVTDIYADTHIIWPGLSKFRFMTGIDALIGKGEGEGATFTYTAPLASTTAPVVPEPSALPLDAEDERTFLGFYGSAEWRPATRLTFSGGLRLNATNEKRDQGVEQSNTRLSGSIGAIFGLWEQGLDHVRVYANYRDTFKPAAFDFGLGEEEEGGEEALLEPETSRSYEAGLKLRGMEGRMDVEVSAFNMDFENLVTPTVVNNQPALINSGKTRFKGVEVATDLRLPRAFVARASYSFHDGKFVDFVQAFDGVPTQLAGKRFEMSARTLASAGLALAPGRGFTASASINYTGDRYLNKRNTALVPGFTAVDAGIGYRTDRVELRVDGRNLGDRRDAVSESEFGDAQYYRMPAMHIRAGVTVRY